MFLGDLKHGVRPHALERFEGREGFAAFHDREVVVENAGVLRRHLPVVRLPHIGQGPIVGKDVVRVVLAHLEVILREGGCGKVDLLHLVQRRNHDVQLLQDMGHAEHFSLADSLLLFQLHH